jgi:DNA-directed RNA polymerase subunit L/DNA-directed RNA polymerase alpha subunit
MTSTGSTTDVLVVKNDTPMSNEMLSDRIGLVPIHVTNPLDWNSEKYKFTLKASNNPDNITYVKSGDFKVEEIRPDGEEPTIIPTNKFFPPNPITRDTCLIASLQSTTIPQSIEIVATATLGTGREHARFCPVSQCSYEYSLDDNQERREAMFNSWLVSAKKVANIDKSSKRYLELQREYNTMQIKKCYLVNEKAEPYSYDFTVESVGVLSVPYIVEQACEVGENMCSRYVNIDKGELPNEITISSTDTRLIGYDFMFRGHDHTLGKLLQSWLVEHHIEGSSEPRITYAGYSIPHPLRDEMVLRIGVEDGSESSARKAVAVAARGCAEMLGQMRNAWLNATSSNREKTDVTSIRRSRTPRIAQH